jgi:hypothetical protein
LDITSRLRPISDETTTAKRLTKLKPDYDGPSSRASQSACYYDGPIMHGPFSCDCPGDGCIFLSFVKR